MTIDQKLQAAADLFGIDVTVFYTFIAGKENQTLLVNGRSSPTLAGLMTGLDLSNNVKLFRNIEYVDPIYQSMDEIGDPTRFTLKSTDLPESNNAAFEAALSRLEAAGGGTLYLNPGVHTPITRTVMVGSNIKICGLGDVKWLCADRSGVASKGIMDGSVQTNIHFENIEFMAKSGGIAMFHVDGGTIHNVRTRVMAGHLVDIGGSNNIKISDCYANGSGLSPFQVDTSNTTGTVGYTTDWGVGYPNAAYGKESSNITFDGNHIVNTQHGIHIHRADSKGLVIKNNIIEIEAGVKVVNAVAVYFDTFIDVQDVVIIDNEFKGYFYTHIALSDSFSNLVIERNIFQGSATVGAIKMLKPKGHKQGKDLTIRNNTYIDVNLVYGINNCTGLIIEGEKYNNETSLGELGNCVGTEVSISESQGANAKNLTLSGTTSGVFRTGGSMIPTIVGNKTDCRVFFDTTTVPSITTLANGSEAHARGSNATVYKWVKTAAGWKPVLHKDAT